MVYNVYSKSNDGSNPWYHGTIESSSFEDACKGLAQIDREFACDFDFKTMTFCGRKLFNKIDFDKLPSCGSPNENGVTVVKGEWDD